MGIINRTKWKRSSFGKGK